MAAITRKIDQVDNIPVDAFPCVITFRNEVISDISDNFIKQTVCEYKPYVDEGILAVTDASVIGERGTWATIVITRKGKELYRDQGIMSSPNLSSYRAELQGCKGALLLLNKFNKDTPRVLLCDNMSAIQSLNKLRNHLPNVNQSDYNILLEIKELIQPTISFQHVKGHQGTELSTSSIYKPI
jgi:ribonuclease HI